jgi:hypothetical protein
MTVKSFPIEVKSAVPVELHRCSGDVEPRPGPPPSRRLEQEAAPLLAELEQRKAVAQNSRRTPVLLLHGASASRETFLFPPGASLVDFLLRYTNLEPWLLDWRGSGYVTDRYLADGRAMGSAFSFDDAAKEDIPHALSAIATHSGSAESMPVLGHCMGAASLARSIAGGDLDKAKARPSHIVLSTIGLFFEVSVDGRLKAEDHVLERLWSEGTKLIDPRVDLIEGRRGTKPRNPWPAELEKMFGAWPQWFKPHRRRRDRGEANGQRHRARADVLETCNRLSFMYGEPYYEPALHPAIHGSHDELKSQFGAIPLQMYLHAAQAVRRGWIAGFEDKEHESTRDEFIGEPARSRFDDIHITLITGALNRLWHRDSIDRMYEWLMRPPTERRTPDSRNRRCEKIIFPNNGHQDLLWGQNSWYEVFPRIADALTA